MNQNRAKLGIYLLGFILLATNAISPAMASISAAFPEASAVTVQMVLLLPQLMSVPFVIFGGAIAQRFSKKKLIILSLILFSAGGVTGFFTEHLWVLLVSRCVYGVGYGLLVPASLGIASDMFFGTADYDHVVGMQYSLKSIGSIFYTLFAGMLCAVSWHHTFLLYLSGGVVLVIFCALVPETAPAAVQEGPDQTGDTGFPPILIPAILIGFFYSFCISVNNSNLSYLIEDNSFGTSVASGIVTSLCTVGAAVGAWAYDRILTRCGGATFLIGIICSTAGLLLGGTARGLWMVVICVLLLGFGLGLTNPALLMLVGKASKTTSTLCFSLVMAAMNLGAMLQGTIIPPLAKRIFGGNGVGKPAFLLGAIGCGICIAVACAMLGAVRKQEIQSIHQ
ncbi:MAG: MFS transporter [Oscillospiraceae bacterium]|nr:MFS transporter [Oscillospiraceae bacterium]